MPNSNLNRASFLLLVLCAGSGGALIGWSFPTELVGLAGHLLTTLSMLLAVSLATTAVLASPIHFSASSELKETEKRRVEAILKSDDKVFADGLLLYYFLTLAALIALLALLFFVGSPKPLIHLHWLAAAAGLLVSLVLVLAFRLPILLIRSAKMRNW